MLFFLWLSLLKLSFELQVNAHNFLSTFFLQLSVRFLEVFVDFLSSIKIQSKLAEFDLLFSLELLFIVFLFTLILIAFVSLINLIFLEVIVILFTFSPFLDQLSFSRSVLIQLLYDL